MTRQRRRTRKKRRKYWGGVNGHLREGDVFEIIAPMVGPGNPKVGDIWHVMDITGHHIHAYRVYPSYGAEAIFADNLVGRMLRKIEIEREPGRDAAAARPPQGRRLTWGDGQSEGAAALGLVKVHHQKAHDDVVLRSGYTPVVGGLQAGPGSQRHQVEIPAGLTAGGTFLVNTGTQVLQLQVPEGMGGGQALQFAVSGQYAVPLVPRVWRVRKGSAAREQQHQEIHADIVESCPDELSACRDEYRRKMQAVGELGDDFITGWVALHQFDAEGKQPHECLELLRECRGALRRYKGGGKRRKTRRRRRRRRTRKR